MPAVRPSEITPEALWQSRRAVLGAGLGLIAGLVRPPAAPGRDP